MTLSEEFLNNKKKKKKISEEYLEKRNMINPFLEKEYEKEQIIENENSDSWFEKGAFDDGYQFGDFSKTVVSSLLDVGTNATKGVMKFGEGIGDTLQYSAADVIDFFGNDKKAGEIRNRAKYNAVDSLFEPATKVLDQNSVFGEKSDSISEGLGYVAAISAVSMIPGGILGTSSSTAATITSTAATFTSSYGHGVTEALNSGATIDEARIYGAISGAAEAGSELMFGGLGKISSAMGLSKGALDDVIVGGLTKKIKNKMVKTVMQAGLKAGGEGLEEIVSGFMSAVAKKVTYMKKKDFDDILKDENLIEQFWMGAITSAISQGPSTLRSIRSGTDFVTGRTDNEQKVYDNLLQTRTNDAKTDVAIKNAIEQEKQTLEQLYGRTLNDEEIKKVEQKVREKYKNGKIDVENTKLSRKEKLNIQESVNKDLEDGNISLEQLQKILGENQDLSKDKLLAKSVYENTQKYASYKIEKTDNEKVNVLLQSAADAGLNNTSKTRRKVELISKLVKDTDRQYKFVSPEQLKQLGYREDANGLIDKSTGEILINSHSDRGIQAVVGHETTHIFDSKDNKGKYSKEYIALQDAVIKYAKAKGIYENTVNDIADRYGELLSNESEVKEELTADLVGDLLFNDEKFIESLATKNRNIFQKIYDYIKHIYNMTKADTEEAKALEEVKYRFDKVYKNISEETNTDIKYMNIGLKGLNNASDSLNKSNDAELIQKYKDLQDSVKTAVKMAVDGKSGKEILKATKGLWTKNTQNNQVIFNISDKDLRLKKQLLKNSSIKLVDLIKHEELFLYYPELRDINIKTTTIEDADGEYNPKQKEIRIDNSTLNDITEIKKNIVHELQHAIQDVEGTLTAKGYSSEDKKYFNNILEIEAEDQAQRILRELKGQKVSKLPEVGKDTPVHPEIKEKNLIEKIPYAMYNVFKGYKGVVNQNEINKKYIKNNSIHTNSNSSINKIDNRNIDIGYKRNIGNKDRSGEISRGEGNFSRKVSKKLDEETSKTTKGLEESSSFSLPKLQKGYVRLYRGLNEEYNPNYDRSKIDNVNGYQSWTDSYELAKSYGENVYYIDIPASEIKNDIIDEDSKSDTYGDRNLLYKNDKPVGINGKSGNEYMLYTDHDNYSNIKYNKIDNAKKDIQYSVQKDNKGRTLTKEQQDWIKNVSPEVKDEKGNLITVYHTTTDTGTQFNEFNPVGTPHYRFGDQVVNYYTDSKDMSGSYADSQYKMADTKKLGSIEEVTKYLDSLNNKYTRFELKENKDGTYVIEKTFNFDNNSFYSNLSKELEMLKTTDLETYNNLINRAQKADNGYKMFEDISNDKVDNFLYDFNNKYGEYTAGETAQRILDYIKNNNNTISFSNQNDLYRNLKENLQKKYPKEMGRSNYQYEGYVNLRNPYVIDAEGRNWNQVKVEVSEDVLKEVKDIKSDKNIIFALMDLQRESVEKSHEYHYSNNRKDYQDMNSIIKYFDSYDLREIIKESGWFGFSYSDYVEGYVKSGLELPSGDEKLKDINNFFTDEFSNYKFGDMTLDEFVKEYHKLYKENLLYEYDSSYFKENYTKIYNKNKIITPEELFQISKDGFINKSINEVFGDKETTNDIVKKVIEMNTNGANYDGVIIKNTIDYGGIPSEIRKPANLYVTFNANQFKSYDNTTPTEDTDIRYSVTENKITGDDIAVKDLLKQNKTTIDDMIGPPETKNTIEDILMQTPEEKQQGMKEKAKKYINRSKTKFINNIVDSFGTSKIANTKTLNSVIDEIRTELTKKGNLTAEKTKEYFDKLYNNLVKIDTLYYDTYKNVKDDIRNTKIYISDSISNDAVFYNDFRKKNMGTMILTKDDSNIPVDVYYMEMSEMYPELFPSDIINPTDQLQRISDVAKDISKVETNVAAYNDKYMGKEYRLWAKEEFDKYINDFTRDIKMAERYNNESILSERAILTKEEIKESYKKLPQAKRIYEKALAKEVLTKEDKLQVDRLVNNEIDITEISKGSNKEGIIRLARAKIEYNRLQKEIQEYQKNIKEYRIQQAKEDIGNIDLWKDKNLGFKYSRETPVRNIYDIAPKDVAEKIANKYFRTYSETNEKKVVDTINTYNDRIRNLDIDTKNKYNVVIDSRGRKVSESALVQLLGEGKITSEDIKDAGANVNKIENAVKEFRNIYNELITQINESMLENGYAPVEYRKDYFPHFTEEKTDTLLGKAAKLLGINVTNREELPTDIAGQTANFKPGRTWFGNLLQRTTDLTDYDALKGFDKYVRGAADLIYHTGDIQNLRALSTAIRGLYNDTELKNEIEAINESPMTEYEKSLSVQEVYNRYKDKSHLSKFIEWLDNYTNILAGKKAINDRGAEKELNRQMYKTMQDIESRIAANTIGGNIGVSLTNFAPISQAWGEIKTHNLLNGMWQTMKSAIKKDSSFASESQFITRRRGADTLVESTVDKITKPINTVLGFADNFTSEVIVRSRYIQNLQEGMSKENALEEADRYASGLMADRGRGALPTQFSNKNPISKMINMFQTEVNNQWSYYLKDLPKNLQEKANGNKTKVIANTALAYTKIMVGAHLINELLGTVRGNSTRVLPDPIYIIGELIKGLSDDDDENDDETVISTITEVAGNIPFVSLPATLFADSMGLDVGDIGRVSISGAIPNVADITSDVVDMINKEQSVGDGLKSIGSELLDTAGASLLLPYGGGQIRKTVKGLSLYENDLPGNYTESGDLRYTVEDDVGSKIKSAIFGAYANPYAQDYIESGFKTIKKENIDEMVGLDMNSTEYRQYKTKLNKFSNKSEKLNYIDSLDLEDSQKSLAANNLNKNAKKRIDMSEYGNYSSYEEYTYARDYPEKYVVASQIATYDEYMGYKDAIADIKEQYSTEAGYSSSERKQLVQNYINTLDLDMYQKIMLEKMAGGYSIKNFQNYIYEYLESTNLTEKEKYSIWNELFN